MAIKVDFQDHADEIRSALSQQALKALEECGMYAETKAKENITINRAVDTGALRNSVTHQVVSGEGAVYIGSNLKYAPYVEFGTGKYYSGGRQTPWVYKDQDGKWHKTSGMKPRAYLKPAITDNGEVFKNIIKNNLSS